MELFKRVKLSDLNAAELIKINVFCSVERAVVIVGLQGLVTFFPRYLPVRCGWSGLGAKRHSHGDRQAAQTHKLSHELNPDGILTSNKHLGLT